MKANIEIYKIFDKQQITEKFAKREFIGKYKYNFQYPEFVKFEFQQNNCDILDNWETGQFVTVEFDLRGREWKNKQGELVYFNTLVAYKLSPLNSDDDNIPDPIVEIPDDVVYRKSTKTVKKNELKLPPTIDTDNDELPF